MYAGRVACCLLVSPVEYAPTGQTDRRADARPLHYAFVDKHARLPDFGEDFRSDVSERSADGPQRLGDDRRQTEVAELQ